MAKHSTNYTNALILPAPDCPSGTAKTPAKVGGVAGLQHALLTAAPYQMTSDHLLCAITALRKDRPNDAALRTEIFSKGQPCLRASPLTKTHGWAVHHDKDARIALIDPASDAFAELARDAAVTQTPAMRNKRAL